MALNLGAVKCGIRIICHSSPYEVLEARHLQLGRGRAKLITKLRNLLDNSVIEKTFRGDEKIEEADVTYQGAQFLYADNDNCYVMDNKTFEQKAIQLETKKRLLLKEGINLDLVVWQNKIIDIRLPKKIPLKVVHSEPAIRGNTVTNALKDARLETGVTVQVPLFIQTGDTILVNSENGSYDSRI